jgi:hypothetical protein
LGLI